MGILMPDRPSPLCPKTVAFYLPQFHRIPENDEWWGEGFTEWTNVRRARPLFDGHEQPAVPGELGYYDLMDPEVPERQAALAREHLVDAFCYYHYWFHGKELLEQPLDRMISAGKPDFPFMVCWANENWTRRWDAGNSLILQPQAYSAEDDVAHIRRLLPIFGDPRYLRLAGKLVFAVYQVHELPEPKATTERWRVAVGRAGLGEMHLVSVHGKPISHPDPASYGFDAVVRSVPGSMPPLVEGGRGLGRRVRERLGISLTGPLSRTWRTLSSATSGPTRVDYRDYMAAFADRERPPWVEYPTVMPRWDNTPRTERRGTVFTGAYPDSYGHFLQKELTLTSARHGPDSLIFVNAWNEWAEGAYLEPDERRGRAFLQAHARAVASFEVG